MKTQSRKKSPKYAKAKSKSDSTKSKPVSSLQKASGAKRSLRVKRIIWAVDPFEEKNPNQERIVETLHSLIQSTSKNIKWEIEPVYVLSPDQIGLPYDYAPTLVENYEPNAQKALNAFFKKVKLPGLLEPKVIVHRYSSLRSLTHEFTRYAEESKAELLVVGTHGRKGLARVILGSFTETLLSFSNLPVLVVGMNVQKNVDFSKILFPTLLETPPGESALPRVVSLAKDLNSKVTLLHSIQRLLEPAFQSGAYLLGGGWVTLPHFTDRQGSLKEKEAKNWVEYAKRHKVQAEYLIDADVPNSVDSIIQNAHIHHAGLIVIEAKKGPVASALIGSITRQIVRLANCPVWVLR